MSDVTVEYDEFSKLMGKLSYVTGVEKEPVCDETDEEQTLYSVEIDNDDPESRNAVAEVRSIFNSCVTTTVQTTAFEKDGSVYLYPEVTEDNSASSFSPSKHRIQ